MWKFVSGCLGLCEGPEESANRKVSHVFPTQLSGGDIAPSDKNDEKFYYIKDEEEIDKVIDDLDQIIIMDDNTINTLNRLISNLKKQKSKLEIVPSYNSVNNFSAVREEAEEDSPIYFKDKITPKDESPVRSPLQSQANTNTTDASASRMKMEIKQGTLLIDVQRGHFLHSMFLKKYGLEKPYVVIGIYYTEKLKYRPTEPSHTKMIEIKKLETQKAEGSIRSEWDEVFEHTFDEERKVGLYSFGFTLFYTYKANGRSYKVASEQVFSVGSLLDQNAQVKIIDFKDPELKGVLARLRVRFQFLHDPELLKEKLTTELKTKIERLSKVKDKNPVIQAEKKNRLSRLHSIKLSTSRRDSELSVSSTHENEETGYYVS